jgi:hypothetical protein
MPRQSYAQLFEGWGVLTRSVDALETREPSIEARRKDLETELEEAKRLQGQYMKLLGKIRTTSEQLQRSVAHGKEAESRLRLLLRGTYGSASPQLIKHGIPPRRAPRRKKGEAVEEPPPGDAPQTESES